jgi:hypothetical protein
MTQANPTVEWLVSIRIDKLVELSLRPEYLYISPLLTNSDTG